MKTETIQEHQLEVSRLRYMLKDSRRNKPACWQLLETEYPQSIVADVYSDELALRILDLLNGDDPTFRNE